MISTLLLLIVCMQALNNRYNGKLVNNKNNINNNCNSNSNESDDNKDAVDNFSNTAISI